MELTAALVALDANLDPMSSLGDLLAAGVELEGSAAAVRPQAHATLRRRLTGLGPHLVEVAETLPWPTAAWMAVTAADTDVVLALDVGDALDCRWLAQARRVIRDGRSIVVSVTRTNRGAPRLGPMLVAREAVSGIRGLDTGLRSRAQALRSVVARARAAGLGVSCIESRGAVASEAWDVAVELDPGSHEPDASGRPAPTAVLVASDPLLLFGPLPSSAAEVLRDGGYGVVLATPDRTVPDVLVRHVDDLAGDTRLFVDIAICFDPSALLRTRAVLSRDNPMTAFLLVVNPDSAPEAEMQRAIRSADVVASVGDNTAGIAGIPLRPAIAVVSDGPGTRLNEHAWRSVVGGALDHRRRVLGYGSS